jgi:hypothetical protein
MPLTSKLALSVTADLTKTLDLTTGRVPLAKTYQAVLSSGVAVGQADLIFHDQRTLAASTNEDLDLIGTMLQDAFGANLAMLRVKGLIIAAKGVTDANGVTITPNVNNVVVGAAASNAWTTLLNSTGTVTLRPGATWCAFADFTDSTGYAVTAGTGDLLRVANGGAGTSVTYDVIVIGASA